MATVIGPTPPGTGVNAPATGSTLARSTSPVSLPVSGSRVIPTSMTMAPGLTCSSVISPRLPVAAIRMSAVRVRAGRSTVCGCSIADLKPTSSAARCLPLTYVVDARSSPTWITVMPGRRWPGWRPMARRSSSRIASAWARPSIRRADTGLSLVSGAGDLDREGLEIREWRALADPDRHPTDARQLEDGGGDPLGHRFQEIGRLAFENLARRFLEDRIAHGVRDAIARRRSGGVERHLEIGREGLAQLALGRVIAVIAEGGQARQDERAPGAVGALARSGRRVCRQ